MDLNNAKSIIKKLYKGEELASKEAVFAENACLKKKIREMEEY